MFYNTEISIRKQLNYPPFCDIILIGFNSIFEKEIIEVSNSVYNYLIQKLNNNLFTILKPMPSPIDKIQNKYRWRIIIKGHIDENANQILNECLQQVYDKNYKNTRIAIDVNPNNMM